MVVNGLTLNASNYQSVVKSSSGSLYVPVKPSAVIYSQLNYVHGKAASKGQHGVPLNKVRILNTLISQLVNMKSKSGSLKTDITELSEDQKDALIKTYQKEIQTAVAQSNMAGTYGMAGVMPEPGALFSITV